MSIVIVSVIIQSEVTILAIDFLARIIGLKSHKVYFVLPDLLRSFDDVERGNSTLSAQLDALADLKFTYVISCQMFGSQKASGDPRAHDILDLMIR